MWLLLLVSHDAPPVKNGLIEMETQGNSRSDAIVSAHDLTNQIAPRSVKMGTSIFVDF